jgi:hypothetical protein
MDTPPHPPGLSTATLVMRLRTVPRTLDPHGGGGVDAWGEATRSAINWSAPATGTKRARLPVSENFDELQLPGRNGGQGRD